MARLTSREEEVLLLVGQSMSCKQIAGSLAISEFTVRKHRASILRKMRLGTTAQLTAFAKTSFAKTSFANASHPGETSHHADQRERHDRSF
ncbi:response regulator transcription factor [Tardiphaga sp.]|uniref:response regulator transcription factor n=1 Tax=Tardiphaga sp. TaxID=1926292 RepID=UPI00352A34BD